MDVMGDDLGQGHQTSDIAQQTEKNIKYQLQLLMLLEAPPNYHGRACCGFLPL